MEDEEDEAEITRCVCTFQDYPGPPTLPGKTRDVQHASLADPDGLNEENSLFIQCDHCKLLLYRIDDICKRSADLGCLSRVA